MSIYGCQYNDSINESGMITMSLQEQFDLQNSIIELLSESVDIDEIFMNEGYDLLSEGANIEYTKAFREGKKAYKYNIKLAKKNLKAGNVSEASQYLKKASKNVSDIEKTIKSMDSTVGSAVFGFFAYGLCNFCEMFLPLMLGCVSNVATTNSYINTMKGLVAGEELSKIKNYVSTFKISIGATKVAQIWTIIKEVVIMIKDIRQIINEIKNEDKADNIMNLYRTKLLRYCVDLQKNIIKFENKISKIN